MVELDILYQDEHYVAVYKPAGMLVHRTMLASARIVVLQCLRDQLGRRVYPIHRLDRPTAGVLIFGLSSEAARALVGCFEARTVRKEYLAVVRGYCEPEGRIDYALSDPETGKDSQPAITDFKRLATVELPIPVARYQTARYSLMQAWPLTGRRHQLRKHFAHLRHPIIGDTTHGVGEQNRLFRDHFDWHRLLLLARSLCFEHPYTGESIRVFAEPDAEMADLLARLDWLETVAEPSLSP
ncbi:hypothetical protein CAI21_20235 [Alkalilimnicola ehrlichii]|uniref:tRNA pseudouridine synthase C n=1 Tax=Alkalilimnicola ehrlichii TaxID=351052 RepID=A0A3E0WH19_9GAMM|nr:pseudouridine synthase [Alkalilimnicola ehrlichii]RFA24800.1 hypothetical protein CAI21_20235 [Alkalilimnicola ehrlichii]RFA32058.1 hypothetical protein CAL65_20695 [Alkalilimnicola ehrlichii]